MTGPRRATGRSVRVTLTEADLYILGRALGALDVLILDNRERTLDRTEVHHLWGRMKDAERRLAQ